MQTYRKKTLPGLEIEAVQLTAENASEVARWCNGLLIEQQDAVNPLMRIPGINVQTEYGKERATQGDFIFKTKGSGFRIRKPGEFNDIWEEVE